MKHPRILAATTALLTAATVVAVQAGPASAATAVTTTADAYTNTGAPASNFGKACCLAVGGGHYVTYLRFQVPADAVSATLTLSVDSQTFAGSTSTFKVSQAGDSWSETGLTKNNAPAIGATLGTFTGAKTNGTISASLPDVSALAGQQVTLALSANTGTDDLWLWGREHNVLSKTPTLTVTTSSSGGGGTSTAPVVGVLGDSIAVGCCASDGQYVTRPFWAVAGDRLGWQMGAVNAVGGSGYVVAGSGSPYPARIAGFLDAHPELDALIVEGGGNDGGIGQTTETNAADQVFDTIASRRPDLKVYVLGPYSNGDPAHDATAQRQAISQAAQAHGFPFIDQVAEGWMVGRGDLLYSDHFHPNDGGHQLLGDRLAGDLAVLACEGCLP